MVGTRRRGRKHVLWFHRLAREENLEIAALCDVDEAVLGAQAEYEKLSGQKARLFTDIRKLLEDKTIDAVSYATPNHWHALGAVWACQAGKDVILEKPASHTVLEAAR